MTRIYFKPQGCSVRNPRGRNWKPGERMKIKRSSDEEDVGNWRKQLDPDAIDQIADGLEKMVLSWSVNATGADSTTPGSASISATSPILNDSNLSSALLLGCRPALEEMMRGELIRTCRPSSLTNGGGGQQSAEASFWYITPATSLACPNNINHAVQLQASPHITPSKQVGSSRSEKLNIQQIHGASHTHLNVRPCIQSMDDGNESGSDTAGAKEQLTCWSKDLSCLPEDSLIKTMPGTFYNQQINGESRNIAKQLLAGTRLTLAAGSFPPLLETKEESVDIHKKKVEELQIALLECAMEYEVKIVEMKMQMLHIRSEDRQKDVSDGSYVKSESEPKFVGELHQLLPASSCLQDRTDGQRVEYLRKQLSRLQREKLAVARELNDLKKRERQFDLQRRSLEDALGRVKNLQRELAKREQEIVDCQLREKEVRAQLYEVQLALHKAQAAQIEPRKLLSLLPALREWLQTIKKVPCDPAFMEAVHEKSSTSHTPPIDSIVCSVTREIQALQRALSKLAAKK